MATSLCKDSVAKRRELYQTGQIAQTRATRAEDGRSWLDGEFVERRTSRDSAGRECWEMVTEVCEGTSDLSSGLPFPYRSTPLSTPTAVVSTPQKLKAQRLQVADLSSREAFLSDRHENK